MRLWDKVLPCFGALLSARVALAEPSLVPVATPVWSAPKGCPDVDFVQARVADLLARPGFVLSSSDLAIVGRIVTVDGKFVLSLDLAGKEGHGVRKFEAGDCRELGEAAALVIAVTIDPNLVTDRPAPSIPLCESKPASSNPAPPPQTVVTPSQPKPSTARTWDLAVAPTVGFGALPSAALGARFEVGRRLRALRLVAAVGYEHSDRREDEGSGGAFTLISGRVGLGYELPGRRSHFGLGLALDSGRLTARGFGVDHPRRVVERWLAPTWLLEWTFDLVEGSDFGVMAEGFIPLGRPEFQLDNSTVFRPAPVGVRLALILRVGIF